MRLGFSGHNGVETVTQSACLEQSQFYGIERVLLSPTEGKPLRVIDFAREESQNIVKTVLIGQHISMDLDTLKA